MKTTRYSKKGFTLVELLAVIAIIGILGGLSFAAFARYQAKANIDKTQVQMLAIAAAIEEYRVDHGNPPVAGRYLNPPQGGSSDPPYGLDDDTGDNTAKEPGTQNSLSTIGLLEALFPRDRNKKIYMSELDPDDIGSSLDTDREEGIFDPFGFPYVYSSDGAYKPSSTQRNPDYDLFSVGPDGVYDEQRPYDTSSFRNVDNIYMK